MDATYSLKSRGDSLESFAASDQDEDYELDFESESEQGDEWEDLGIGSDSSSDGGAQDEGVSVAIEPRVQMHHQHFKADATTATRIGKRDSNDCEMTMDDEPESEPESVEDDELTRATEASALVVGISSAAPTTSTERTAHSRVQTVLSSSAKSRDAKEALRTFYLLKAKQAEATRKLIVVHQPLQTPPPQIAILPLKAPVRYPVAVQEEALRSENELKAKLALEQFYQARELAKQTRTALNRSNEAKLVQSQSGRGVFLHGDAPRDQARAWDSLQRILTR